MPESNPRARAAVVLQALLSQNGSLATHLGADDDALTRELCHGSCRWYHRLEACLTPLLKHPIKRKDLDLHCLLIVGLYQLQFMRLPAHASVNETVAATRSLKKPWAKNLVNAVLRSFQRQQAELLAGADTSPQSRWAHPAWLITECRDAWPEQWQDILAANNHQGPMTLRLNRRALALQESDRPHWLASLADRELAGQAGTLGDMAVYLDSPTGVDKLPGFHEGLVSVQDEASQLVAPLLDARAGHRVLDACAAPGGKTAHILEQQADLELLALDIEQRRLERVRQNLERLQLQAELRCADARDTAAWWDGRAFDRILLDAPCSATGIIRRQPDIKLLRRAGDVARLTQLQQELLDALWPCLATGGLLLYTSCSVLPAENADQIEHFLQRHGDAVLCPIPEEYGLDTGHGRQRFPAAEGQGPDGFFYALIRKT